MSRLSSTAVMARRHEPATSLDFFPTPPWATRAFAEHVMPVAWPLPDRFRGTAFDPACGEGHMAVVLGEYFDRAIAADIHDYGFGDRFPAQVADFLNPEYRRYADWIVTNPPFNRAEAFVAKALQLARRGVAMLVRTSFLETDGRWRTLYSHRPPELVAISAERIPMHRGRWVINGSSATAYAWLVWRANPPHDWRFTRTIWIPPGRRRALTRHDDWLTFGGCMDIPAGHPAIAVRKAKAEPEEALL